MVQFSTTRDVTLKTFAFEELRPNAAATDLLGEGFCRKKMQSSLDRGMFYVWADKLGTVRLPSGALCVAGNYAPAWTDTKCKYQVLGAWAEKLWKQYKLSDEQYQEYLYQTKDGLPARLRNLEVYQEWKRKRAHEKAVEERTKRIRGNPELYQPFPRVQEAEDWLELFKVERCRYPVLLVHAPSYAGKTEFAMSLFQNPLKAEVGHLVDQFPDKLRKLDREKHDGLVLDDLRDLAFLGKHQDKLQGHYSSSVELGTTPSGQFAFEVDFYRLPVVLTVNNDTKNLSFLREHDWCSKPVNVRVLSFKGRPGTAPPASSVELV
jgi:hypothetical protein